jgi:small subunit ribosomal protein S20
MANIKANKKAARQDIKRGIANKTVRTRLKGVVKAFGAAPSKAAASLASSTLDRAVKTGVIHRNKANRLKSRMATALSSKK